MKIEINSKANGIIISVDGEEYVVQEFDDEVKAVEAWREVLSTIYEEYGPCASRYSQARLYFTIAPGDKNDNFTDTLFQ